MVRIQHRKPNHSYVSLFILLPAMAFMLYVTIRHWTDEWGPFALYYQCLPGIIGFIGYQLLNREPIWPAKFAELDNDTGMHTAIVIAGVAVVQILAQMKITITELEYVFYVSFAAPLEEMMWRGFVITALLAIFGRSIPAKVAAVGISSLAFASLHFSYYGDWPTLIATFLSGVVLGICFVLWEDLTANILGHFIWNFGLAFGTTNDYVVWIVLGVSFAAIFIFAFAFSAIKKKPTKLKSPRSRVKYRR